MWLVTLLSLSARAQTVQLTPADRGATVLLTTPGVFYVADLTDPRLDLDQVSLATPTDQTTFGLIHDGLVASGVAPDDLLMVTIDIDGRLLALMVDDDDDDRPPLGPDCWVMLEERCIFLGQRFCEWVWVEVCPEDLTVRG